MAKEALAGTTGDNIVPHDSNPLSQSLADDVKAAMDEAQAKADESPPEEKEADAPESALQPDASPETEAPASDKSDEGEIGDLEPPTDWTAENQAVFRNMDKAGQEWALGIDKMRREQHEAQMAALQPWQQVQTQWDPYFKQLGGNPAQLINGLMQTEHQLRTGTPQQKLAALNQIVQAYGMADMVAQAMGQTQAPQVSEELAGDPVMQAISPELQRIQQGLSELQSQMGNQFGAIQSQQLTQQVNALEAWKSEVDEKGSLKRPYANEVEGTMQALAQHAESTGQQTTLDAVYEQACRAHPEVWAKIQSAQQTAGLLERQKAAADKAAASKSVSGSPVSQRTNRLHNMKQGESLDESIKAAMQLAGGGNA